MSALGYDRRRVYLDHLRRSPNLYRAAKELLVPAEDPVGVVCSYVLAPAVGAFTMWLLNQAEKKKIQRLYFLSRDGYLFYQAARILCEAYHLPLECRYLSCSRYSLRQGMFHLDRKSALEHICRNGMEVTPSVVLRRAGLTADEQREVLHRLCLPYEKKHLLEGRELRSLQKRLSRCGLFFSYMDRHSRQALPGLTGYLQQEGLLENVKYAVVDSGWTGTTQKTLGEILRYMGRRELLEGYYWGLYELPEGVNPKAYHSYYFSPTGGLREKVAFHNCLFEVLCAAGHGMTLGYEKQRNRWAPRYGAIFPEEKEFAAKAEKYVTSYIRKLSRQPVNDGGVP